MTVSDLFGIMLLAGMLASTLLLATTS